MDVAGLLSAQEVARAPQLQVHGGHAEARAQLGEVLQGLQPAAGVLADLVLGRDQQVGVGRHIAAAHAAPQLVELAEAEGVGAVDDEGVGVGDVEAVLHDGGGHQHIHAALHEGQHHLLQALVRELPVAHGDAGVRHQLPHPRSDGDDGLHAVVDEVDLAAAAQLELDGGLHELVAPGRHHGLDGEAVLGRGLDEADLPQAREAHVEGARNGRGAQRELVHVQPQLLQLLLVAHAEALLLVDDHEAQIRELYPGPQQLVRADDDVHLAVTDVLQDLLLLRGIHEAVEHLDANREACEALLEGAEVLVAEHRGRAQHRHLAALQGHLGSGAHGHLGLAEAHVAHQQPVHGSGRLQVGLDRLAGLDLVRRGRERKVGLESRHVRPVRRVGVALLELALSVELEQLVGHVSDGLLGLPLDLGPAGAAQLVQGRQVALGPGVALDEVGPLQADVQLAAVGVAQL